MTTRRRTLLLSVLSAAAAMAASSSELWQRLRWPRKASTTGEPASRGHRDERLGIRVVPLPDDQVGPGEKLAG